MNRRQIDRFFAVLGRELTVSATAIVTGAAAGALWGHVRPSLDIDFAIRPSGGQRQWGQVESAVERARQLTGVTANYAVDIDRWGAISLLDYRRHTQPYKAFGRLTVRLLDPAYWTIGKLTRYLQPDIDDMVAVLTRKEQAVHPLVRLWGQALRKSPRSVACSQFRRQVEDFLTTSGPTIWGKAFDAQKTIADFHQSAGISD
ncbi:MAG: hypothetical protein A3B78_01480 [Omnitrophica WOR_2 bacterium RIFCSPHIGHO2_02_FULL_67_20]|nr:MAG: hypothetical protein A3B78_01480 [Omnitrophica WOR_2 bacterium RIFCSPHIGHO2_02_FULL_67_20]